MSGSFSSALSPNDNSGGKVLILNGTFTQSYSTYKSLKKILFTNGMI
jgi:hypothetical protein